MTKTSKKWRVSSKARESRGAPRRARQTRVKKSALKRFRTVFVLDKLSPRARSDVLADGTLSETWQVPVQHPVELGPCPTVSRASLFAAFRAAADGRQPLPLKDLKGKTLKAKTPVDPDR